GTEATVDLVGTDLHVALNGKLAGRIEQDLCTEHVGADKRSGVVDAAIDVTFRGEVQNGANARANDSAHGLAVGSITLDETTTRVAQQVCQVRQVAGVAEAVEVDKGYVAFRVEQVADEVAADEAAAAGHQNRFHERLSSAIRLIVLERYRIACKAASGEGGLR